MSKITFRADDDLIDRLEGFEASKSEIMRKALRSYLDDGPDTPPNSSETAENTDSIDSLITDRVNERIAERLDTVRSAQQPPDINVNITLDGENASMSRSQADERSAADASSHSDVRGSKRRKTESAERESTEPAGQTTCAQCGENLSDSHVYCPNCGEKASHRIFCDCGDELRSDWGFCPSCGRRTPAADVLDQTRSGANRE